MILLVTGSRTWTDSDTVTDVLDSLPISRLIVGDARGADAFARKWTCGKTCSASFYAAHWDLHGKAAGPKRNQEMLEQRPDLVVAFRELGESKGTDDMVERAMRAGVPVMMVTPTPQMWERGTCAACGFTGHVLLLTDEPTECPLCGRCRLM